MSKLPDMVYADKITKSTQVVFGGLRHHAACADGEIYDCENISAELYPVMSVRKGRMSYNAISGSVAQIYADKGKLIEAGGDGLFYDRINLIAKIADPENTSFIRFGDRVVMMPDKLLLNTKYNVLGIKQNKGELPADAALYDAYAIHDEAGHYSIWVWDGEKWVDNGWFDEPIETAKTFGEVTIKNGTYKDEAAEANTIEVTNTEEYVKSSLRLKEGDAVEISGMTKEPRNNKVAIIREIAATDMGTCEIRFLENCFYIPEDGESYKETDVTIKRSMPDMDFLFEHGNRLWGAKGKEIFACKLGDPRNWNVFDGLATDSWYLESQSKGEFTGGISYSYPRFFKEDSLLTIYGSAPSSYQTNEQKIGGLVAEEHRSLETANGLLFWISKRGMMIFDGSSARLQDQVFGDWQLKNVISKADATKCYVAAKLPDGLNAIFCYDTNRGLWVKENGYDGKIISMTYDEGKIYALEEGYDGILWLNGESEQDENGAPVESFVEFGDFTENSPNRKAVSKLQLRLELEEGAMVTVWLSYEGRSWIKAKEIRQGKKRSVYIPVIPHRCDYYRIKISGSGQWKLFSLTREFYIGSEIH